MLMETCMPGLANHPSYSISSI